MATDNLQTQMPSSYTDLVVEKSNFLLRANMHEAQQQFEEAAELFAKSAKIEAELAATALKNQQPETALIHLISEMSCWAAAGDTYRALSRGRDVLAMKSLTPDQRTHINDFMEQLNQRRRVWMASWGYQTSAAA